MPISVHGQGCLASTPVYHYSDQLRATGAHPRPGKPCQQQLGDVVRETPVAAAPGGRRKQQSGQATTNKG